MRTSAPPHTFYYACLILLCAASSDSVNGDDWRQFRGAQAGKLAKIEHPMEWGPEQNVAWTVPMKGSGWSSPIVVGDRIFITSAEAADGSRPKGMMAGVASMRSFRNAKPSKHSYTVTCLSLSDGTEIWRQVVGESVPPAVHPSNTYATESPASDGERVFTFFATTGALVAWDLNGKELWRKELGAYKSGNGFGTGSSLTAAEGRVFVQYDNDEKSFVAAFRADDGAQVWRDDRSTKTSWSSPLLWKHGQETELIACGSGVVTSYQPESGEVIWRLSGIKSAFSASPALAADQIFFGNSGPMSAGPLVSIKAGAQGAIELNDKFEAEQLAWSRTKSGPGMASPVVAQGRIFIPGRGVMNCYDIKSGEQVYKARVPKLATVAASLWADDDHVFVLDENGSTFVMETGPELKIVATNKLDDLFWSTPSIAGDSLLIRGVEKLYCIRK